MDPETENNFKTILEYLEKFIKAETVAGKPIYVGQGFLIPLFRISIGMGTGKSGSNTGSPEGTGFGATIVPHAVISITNDEISIISLGQKGALHAVTEKLPEILKKVGWDDEVRKS